MSAASTTCPPSTAPVSSTSCWPRNSAARKAVMSEQPQQQIFSIEKIYLKDMSLEIPNAPQVFAERESPRVDINLHNEVKLIENGIYEVTLTATVTAKHNDKTAFLVEA